MLACIAGRMAVLRDKTVPAEPETADGTVRARLDWIVGRLRPSPDNEAMAVAVPAIMEGITILEMARPGTTRPARRLLPALPDCSAD